MEVKEPSDAKQSFTNYEWSEWVKRKVEFRPSEAKFNLFKPSRCIKASFYIPENRLNFPTTKGFRMKIFMQLVY